jgi:probable addiction module antidote protein
MPETVLRVRDLRKVFQDVVAVNGIDLEDENPEVFLAAVGNVAKARGMSAIAESTGLGRESLYKAMAPGAKPRYDTVLKVLQSLGVKLTVSAA